MIFPASGTGTVLVLDTESEPDRLPIVRWLGAPLPQSWSLDGVEFAAISGVRRGSALLVEHARGSYLRPGLVGHRLVVPPGRGAHDIAGRDWSPRFEPISVEDGGDRLVIEARDAVAGLDLRTEIEALVGGALRIRHVLTNTGPQPYLLDALEVSVPIPDSADELLDLTGRHERERMPQRQPVRDGRWTRESRGGRPGLDAATMLVAGPGGFGFDRGEVVAVSVATSGNSVLAVERSAAETARIGGGELLRPGEIALTEGDSYTTPWVFVVAAADGLDSIAAALHAWQRSLPAHPGEQPVTLNVWEAVYFDHDLERLRALADRAAEIGVERFVLDDGWFRGRRHDRAGLGDWVVDPDVWPVGLGPLIDHVRGTGMQFGLWFEPEMVNPDSDLYRAHPDWILSTGGRLPLPQRNQQVVDLTNDAAWTQVYEQVHAVLAGYEIDYVKWDHNRPLLDAGRAEHGGAPAGHAQNEAFYRLLDALRVAHPTVAFESCASGGGRIDLGVLERVQRVWTSDMTDALSRQQIQRWTVQLAAPEYLGAHVSSPVSHQTGRTLPLDFRAATALFGAFGIEWDLTEAGADDRARLAEWVDRYKRWRPLLHSGRTVRIETSDPAVLAHGVVAADGRAALIAHVQLDESAHNRGVALRLPGLDPGASYHCTWASEPAAGRVSGSAALDPAGPTGGVAVTGAELARIGLWLPRRWAEQIQLIALERLEK